MREQMHYDTGRKNVVSEHYDEIVFSDPTNSYIMYNLLNNPKPLVPVIGHEAGVDYKELEECQLMSILRRSN